MRQIIVDAVINEQHQLADLPEGIPPCKATVVIKWPEGKELNELTSDQLEITLQLPATPEVLAWFNAWDAAHPENSDT